MLLLPAVLDHLLEKTVIVADAITAARDAEARHTFHKAGSEPPETAIAEGGIRFGAAHAVGIDAEIAERNPDELIASQIADHVVEKPADQKFQRQVIDALGALRIADSIDRQPTMDDAVAQRERRRDEPIPVGRARRILADRQGQLGEHGCLEILDILIRERRVG